MSVNTPATPSAPPKPRSTVERTLVWGGILILLALVGIEYTSRNAQSIAVDSLMTKLKEFEGKGMDLKTSDVKAAVGNKLPRVEDVSGKLLSNGGKRVEIYQWFSINPLKKREMYVYYGVGDDPDVLSVSTEEETESITQLFPDPTPEQKEELLRKAAEGKKKKAPPPETDALKNDAAAQQAPTNESEKKPDAATPPEGSKN